MEGSATSAAADEGRQPRQQTTSTVRAKHVLKVLVGTVKCDFFVSGCRCFASVPHFLPATVPKPLAHVKHNSDGPLSQTSLHTSGEPTCSPFTALSHNTLPLNREPAANSLPLLGDTCSMNTSSCRGIRRPVIRMVFVSLLLPDPSCI